MKQFKFLMSVTFSFSSCSDDDTIVDPVYEFIFFQKEGITVGEANGSMDPVPVTLKLLGYKAANPIQVTLSVQDNNVSEGVDYTISSKTLTFQPGSFLSDTVFISTIDNNQGVDYERSFTLNIESISNPNIKVGLGIEDPSRASLKVIIADDECSDTIEIYNDSLINQTTYDTHDIVGTLNGSDISVTGNLISYGPFSNAELTMTLTPESNGATTGTASFDDYYAGTDADGYEYQFRQVGVGTYDVCSGNILVNFEVYWLSGSNWVYWYTSYNNIKIPVP